MYPHTILPCHLNPHHKSRHESTCPVLSQVLHRCCPVQNLHQLFISSYKAHSLLRPLPPPLLFFCGGVHASTGRPIFLKQAFISISLTTYLPASLVCDHFFATLRTSPRWFIAERSGEWIWICLLGLPVLCGDWAGLGDGGGRDCEGIGIVEGSVEEMC